MTDSTRPIVVAAEFSLRDNGELHTPTLTL